MDLQNLIGLTNGQKTLNLTSTQAETINPSRNEGATVDATQTVGEEFSTFLTLLTAQIKNQDPLAPLDSTQFVEQLATFSGLELQAKGNQVLENIANMLAENLYTSGNQAIRLDDVS